MKIGKWQCEIWVSRRNYFLRICAVCEAQCVLCQRNFSFSLKTQGALYLNLTRMLNYDVKTRCFKSYLCRKLQEMVIFAKMLFLSFWNYIYLWMFEYLLLSSVTLRWNFPQICFAGFCVTTAAVVDLISSLISSIVQPRLRVASSPSLWGG